MAIFTGMVVGTAAGARFNNDDGTQQRLTRARLDEDKFEKEINLTPYIGQRINVSGDWQHDWIYEAVILESRNRGCLTVFLPRWL